MDLSAKFSMLNPVVVSSAQKYQGVAKGLAVTSIEPAKSSHSGYVVNPPKYSPAYGPAKAIRQVHFSQPELADAGSRDLLNNVMRGRIDGGALRLSQLLERGDISYQQDMRQYTTFSFPTKEGQYPPLDLTQFQDLQKNAEQGFTFQLKTKDGDRITFSFEQYKGYGIAKGETQTSQQGAQLVDQRSSSFQGVQVSLNVEGQLSKDESAQLNDLAAKLEQLTIGFLQQGDSSLSQFDFSEFNLMEEIHLKFEKHGEALLSFNYTDTDLYRSIEVDMGGAKSEITIDKTSLGLSFSAEQQANAKRAYMSLLQESATEAKSRNDVAMMQSVFNLGFESLSVENKDQLAQPTKTVKLSEPAQSSLIALPDFDFNYRSRMSKPNAVSQPNEYQGFEMNLSLTTKLSENKNTGKGDIVQTQKFDLEGAYYEPLDHLESVDFEEQNYKHTTFSRSAEKVSHLSLQAGAIESLLVAEQGESEKNTRVYEQGRLVDEIKDSLEFASYRDVSELAQEQNRIQDREILQALIIDPYEKHKSPDERGIVQLDGAVEWLRSEIGQLL